MTSQIPEHLEEIGDVYSNCDHVLDESVAARVAKGEGVGAHTAWNFFGSVWFDQESATFLEEVWRYKNPVALLKGETIKDVIEQANEKYGRK